MLVNSVPQIKDMPGALAVAVQYFLYLIPYALRRAVQHRRVEITLQGHAISRANPCIGQISCPVHTESVAASICHDVQPLAAIFGKQHNGHLASIGFTLQPINDLLHVVQ